MAHDLYYLLSSSATSADPAPFTVTATTGFAATFLATKVAAEPAVAVMVEGAGSEETRGEGTKAIATAEHAMSFTYSDKGGNGAESRCVDWCQWR